eukprot:TRINITY_DN6792_c0_g1_i1.p1 TRINITY_DN6792_c0_g1~~TRINITY_DN6792_c0_g1_i1.p1  ORF type:complete len:424 (+),score=67.49 TRINITY_DN6792_c0_g1_i1:63-1274(+)
MADPESKHLKDRIASLEDQNSQLSRRLEDYKANCGGLPFENEALLLHEVGVLTRQPPFAKTTRRKKLYASIDFPEGVVKYNPAIIERPITLLTDEFKKKTASYNFGALHMDPPELLLHWFVMFSELDLFRKLNLNPETLREFFRLVCNSYRDQVYHNFNHAMDVAQFAYAMYMNSESCRAKLDHVDMFCCLVLGLAHDMDHPGVNNAFLIKTRDPIAILYNDTSVLENAHAASLFYLMTSKPTADLLGNVDDDTYRRCRKTILRGILATDMASHFRLVDEFKAMPSTATVDELDDSSKLKLIECVAKSGDICHLVRPWPIAKAWEDLVMVEFFQQGDQEKALGFEPDGLLDRNKCKIPNSQCWFYENMGKPLFDALAHHVPETEELVTVMMEHNLPNWKAMCA